MVTVVGDQTQEVLRNFFYQKNKQIPGIVCFFCTKFRQNYIMWPLTDNGSISPLGKHLFLKTRSALVHLCVFAFLFCLSELPCPKFSGANQSLSRTTDVRLLEKLDLPSGSVHFNVKTC